VPSLSSLSSLRLHLGVPADDTSEDAFLTQALAQAEALVRKYVRQSWACPAATYTHYLRGNDTDTLVLRERPVVSITSVHLDRGGFYGEGTSAFATGTLLTEGEGYVLVPDGPSGSHSGRLQRIGTVWPAQAEYRLGDLSRSMVPGKGNVKVVFQAGWAAGSVPADIELAVNLIAVNLRSYRLGRPVNSESYDGYSLSLASGKSPMDPLEAGKSLLAPYRSLVPGVS
jgi:hypothetical protein